MREAGVGQAGVAVATMEAVAIASVAIAAAIAAAAIAAVAIAAAAIAAVKMVAWKPCTRRRNCNHNLRAAHAFVRRRAWQASEAKRDGAKRSTGGAHQE